MWRACCILKGLLLLFGQTWHECVFWTGQKRHIIWQDECWIHWSRPAGSCAGEGFHCCRWDVQNMKSFRLCTHFSVFLSLAIWYLRFIDRWMPDLSLGQASIKGLNSSLAALHHFSPAHTLAKSFVELLYLLSASELLLTTITRFWSGVF